MKKKNIFCKWFGHKYVKTVDNRLYYIDTCINCGDSRKIFKMQDTKPTARGPQRW